MFITFEGIDGVGKSTQAQLLYLKLIMEHKRATLTHEPGGTDFGMKVRQLIKTETTLSLASQFHLIEAQRDHHVSNRILPDIADNRIVICDRFIDTSYVYQHDFMNLWDWEEYLSNYRVTPDITFLMYTDNVASIKKRMSDRAGVEMDHFDNASVEKLIRMQNLFFDLIPTFPRIIPINTDRPVEVVADDIWNHVLGSFHEGLVRS
jgi:dTMP kinase